MRTSKDKDLSEMRKDAEVLTVYKLSFYLQANICVKLHILLGEQVFECALR